MACKRINYYAGDVEVTMLPNSGIFLSSFMFGVEFFYWFLGNFSKDDWF